ncbi:trimethylamine methyltransferase family protein [Candidatus Bipolaricaulota bacterium]|nr:trimethylamine methyltransferase family protein [Candidatus Bipolaricaulota bacterium]
MLSEQEKKKIFNKAMYVLEKVGIEIKHGEALELLQEAGAKVEDQRVYLKPYHVEEALTSAPKYVPIYDRNGELALELGSAENYFGPGSDNPSTLDLDTGKRRQSKLADVKNFSLLVDALPNMDFLMSMALPQDVPPELADLYQFRTMTVNNSKPFVFTSADNRNTVELFEMAAAVVGNRDVLEDKPFFIQYTEPTSPLVGSEDALGRLLLSAEYGVPATYTSGTLPGASSPATPAGTVVMSLAEELSGVVLSQFKRPGAPVIIGGAASPMDMKTAGASYGLPAAILIDRALSEVSKYLDMPVFSEAGFSDSKLIDGQQAMEASISITEMARSEADLIHDVGYLESGQTGSLESVVIGNEIVGYIRRLQEGINLNEDHLALEALKRVGPGGGFLTDQSTMNTFKDLYQPELLDRSSYDSWKEKGGKNFRERARVKAKKLLDEHEPIPLSENKVQNMDEIIEEEESKIG